MIENLTNIAMGFTLIFNFKIILCIVIGILVGVGVGVLPGISSPIGIAVLLPFTYSMSPMAALILLCCLYSGAEYGGSITAITINTPGTPMAAATCFDGYELTKQGKPGKALGTSIVASTSGGMFGVLILMLFMAPISNIALAFGPPEYFALATFGLSVAGGLGGKSWAKGMLSALLGLLIATIGMDPLTGTTRFTFGFIQLEEGVTFISILIGLFAVSELFMIVGKLGPVERIKEKISTELINFEEFKGLIGTILRSSVIGTIIGILPGAGATIASFISYNEAKRFSKHPEKFGTGLLEGVAAPEAANNASVGGALVPLLTLGIPGSGSTAILIGALMLHGLKPGPLLIVDHSDIFYGLFASLIVGNVVLLIVGYYGTRLWLKVIETPKQLLVCSVFGICVIGTYAVHNNFLDVWVMLIFGAIGFLLRKFGCSNAAIVLGFILGFMIETQFRRSLILSTGSYGIFFNRPITISFLILAVASWIFTFWRQYTTPKNTK